MCCYCVGREVALQEGLLFRGCGEDSDLGWFETTFYEVFDDCVDYGDLEEIAVFHRVYLLLKSLI